MAHLTYDQFGKKIWPCCHMLFYLCLSSHFLVPTVSYNLKKKMQSVETFFVIVYRQNDRYLKYEYMQLFFLFFLREAIVGSPFILPVNRYEVGRGGPSHYHTLQVVSIAYF